MFSRFPRNINFLRHGLAGGFAFSFRSPRPRHVMALGLATTLVSYTAFNPGRIYLDSPTPLAPPNGLNEETVADPATSIQFPKTLRVPSKTKIPPLTLVGVGVRTVSFLGLKVYSVGFYADLNDPALEVPLNVSPEDKVKYIINNTCCVIRIVPTRSTSYTHLRDAFVRSLQTRLTTAVKEGRLTDEATQAASSSIRKLKGLFPNSPLAKHTPLDILLTAPVPNKQRALVIRDLGSVEDTWVATGLVLHYFEGSAPSPPLKASTLDHLQMFSK